VTRLTLPGYLAKDETRLLILLGSGSFLLMSSLSSINVALPQIQRDFDASLSEIQWVALLGFIISASLTLLFGRVGDVYGRTRVYRTGVLIYSTGSLLCAVAPSLPVLLVFRAVMALGMAMVIPLSAAILAAAARPERRGQLIGVSASFAAAGQLMGPTIGGFILDVFSWRGIFLFNGGAGTLLCAAQFLLLHAGSEERRPGRLDLLGAMLLLIAYPSLLLGLTLGSRNGLTDSTASVCLGLAVGGLVAFAMRELRFPAPLLQLALFRRLSFSAAIAGIGLTAFVQNPITLFVPIYLQTVLELSALDVGLLMVSLPLATLVGGPIGGRLADRYSPGLVAAAGMALMMAGVLVYAQLSHSTPPLIVLIPLVLAGFSAGIARPANQVVAYQTVEKHDYGSLAAMLTSSMMLAGTLGTTTAVALSESLATSGSPAAFAEAQQQTFTLLVPVVALGVAVSLLAGLRRHPASLSAGPQTSLSAARGSQRSP
jgi:EmrB/QacA subfamily drug resistance transporter